MPDRKAAIPVEREAERIRRYFGTRMRGGGGRKSTSAAHEYLMRERQLLTEAAARTLRGTPMDTIRVCDVGCGAGADLAHWRSLGAAEANLAGTELSEDRLVAAKRRLPDTDLRHVSSFDLPFADGSFDLTSASLVLSTITDDEWRTHLFAEMCRITRPGGLVVMYDFRIRKPTNPNVVAMNARRVTQLGARPSLRYPAAPFLPFLGPVLRLPRLVRPWALRALPRTHALWVWRR